MAAQASAEPGNCEPPEDPIVVRSFDETDASAASMAKCQSRVRDGLQKFGARAGLRSGECHKCSILGRIICGVDRPAGELIRLTGRAIAFHG
jgi:hypothetical protein